MHNLLTLENIVYYLLVINVVTFLAYGLDKRAAIRKSWRISEKNLLLMVFIGGTLGGLLGRKIFRHKTKKGDFIGKFWLVLIAQAIFLFWIGRILVNSH